MGLNTFTTRTKTRTTSPLISLSCLYCLWLHSFLTTFIFLMANAEFYSSVDSLRKLGNMEASVLENFRYHLKEQQHEIDIVKRFIKNIKFHHELASKDTIDYIGNPINAFTLIKRMVNDWNDLNEFLKFYEIKNDMKQMLTQLKEDADAIQPPDEHELKGAIRGLGRLQTIYKIKADEMANGYKYGTALNWRDCLEIGATFLDDKNYELSIDWLETAFNKLQKDQKESEEIKTKFIADIKEYLALAYQNIGDLEKALNNLSEILETEPEHTARFTEKFILNVQNMMFDVETPAKSEDVKNYERLCRGETLKKNTKLMCKLESKIHPFFTLSPLQVENVNLNPPINLYHNLLNDAQIFKLQEKTQDRMFRSEVIQVNSSVVNEVRVSQQVWLERTESKIVNMMYNFLELISGFDTKSSEKVQVANYGIGGQYEPHYDFFGQHFKTEGFIGDRIATNMFYLSDVREGGYTVFPALDIYLQPIKGAMVMWHNLFKSLDGDQRTLHAGCPVLKGSKRIANIWTRSGYQEFRRPCDLENDSKVKNKYMCEYYTYNC